MLIGYARSSALEQEAGLEAQLRQLLAAGCHRVFAEQTSSVGPRNVLNAVIESAREGDTLVATKLDRLACSVMHLGEIVERLIAKRVGLRILAMGMDTGPPAGKHMLDVLASVARFEREMMLQRWREGIGR